MGLLKLDVYAGRDLQTFISLLNQFETDGVTDIRFVRERIQNHISSRYQAARPSKIRGRKTMRETPSPCPSCGKPTSIIVVDGEKIISCRACRWSALDEVS